MGRVGQPRRPADRNRRTRVASVSSNEATLYIWFGSDPDIADPDARIPDIPGERDLDLLANAVRSGEFGRVFPVRISYAGRPDPRSGQWKSIDTARFLSDYSIRHRRRYEVLLDTEQDDANGSDETSE